MVTSTFIKVPVFPIFEPAERLLMGPGPSPIYPSVLQSLAKPTLGHLDPQFISMMDELKQMTQYAFQTSYPLTFIVSAPGSAGMETAFVNLVEPGEKVIVCKNGVFGGRMLENVLRCGGIPVVIEQEWGKPVDPNSLEETLKVHPDSKMVAFVHAETSTGAASDAALLCSIASKYGCLSIVDSVTGLGGIPLFAEEWAADAIYSGSQKCLSCIPGLSPVAFSPRAAEKIKNRKSKVQSWFLDLNLVMAYWEDGLQAGQRAYHHTAPINSLYALHEALRLLCIEGLENAWNRHREMHLLLLDGLQNLGFTFLVDEPFRLPQLNAVLLPPGIENEANLRKKLLLEHQLEVGAGLGALSGKIWRIGLMGYGANKENINRCLEAIKKVL
ncbi:MAG: serine-pyruvate aminotransferase AgxT [Bacteroidota bacterium]|jgi:alanine-glyoxylate transaminase/serine-glyoxylate transaminase/serine-pyruvate transaminase